MTYTSLYIIAFSLLTAVRTTSAQAVTMANASQETAASGAVTMSLHNTLVKDALSEISRQSGVIIHMGDDVLASKARVSVQLISATTLHAIDAVLKNTEFVARKSEMGGLVIAKASATSNHKVQGVITGKVTDAKTGRGISGATVAVGGDRGVSTADDGSYRLINVTTGTQTVTVRLVGYAKQTRVITIGEGATVTVDFKLEPSANVLDQVIVTGTIAATELKAVPNAITVITAKQIEERGITRIDQLFRGDVPGLFAMNLGSDALLDEVTMFSRGTTALSGGSSAGIDAKTSNTNPIKTYIDGVEMADYKYLSQIDPASIERIEILTGPQASTVYGSNALNGVMQIFTKRGTGNRPQITLSLIGGVTENNFSNHLAPSYTTDSRASGIEGRLSYNVGGSWNYEGAWTPSKLTQRFSVNGGARMDLGKLTADLSARQGLTKNRQAGQSSQTLAHLQSSGVDLPNPNWGAAVHASSSAIGRTLGMTLSYRPFAWWSHEVVVGDDNLDAEYMRTVPGYTNKTDTSLSISQSSTSRSSQQYTTTAQLPLTSLAHLNLTLGGDHWRVTNSLFSSSDTPFLTGSIPNVSVTRVRPDKNSGAFVQGQLSVKDALFFTYGVRAEWNPNIGDNVNVAPGRYGVSYTHDIGDLSIKLRGSYGRSIRPPVPGSKLAQPYDLSEELRESFGGPVDQVLANQNLLPEHQQGGEGGIELYMGNRGSLVLTRFNQTVDNLIYFAYGIDSVRSLSDDPVNAGLCIASPGDPDGYCYLIQSQVLNAASIRNQGWEAQGSVTMGPLTTRGTYSWTKSRVLGVTPRYKTLLANQGIIEGSPPFYMPEHTWGLGVTYAHAASTVSLNLNGVGEIWRSLTDDLYIATGAVAAARTIRNQTSRPRMGLPAGFVRPSVGYATADLNAAHRLNSRADITFQVRNLTDHYGNDLSSLNVTMGRQSKIGMRVRLN